MKIRNIFLRFGRKILSFLPSGIVLMYHRVCDDDFDPYGICVSQKNFLEHLKILKENFDIIPVRLVPEYVKRKFVGKKKFIAITFDDGYSDNIKAFEILDYMKIHATLFVITGHLLDKNSKDTIKRILWWERLKGLFSKDFKKLILKIRDKEISFIVENHLSNLKVQVKKRSFEAGKHIIRKNELFSYLYTELKYTREDQRERILCSIEDQIGAVSLDQDILLSERDIESVGKSGFSVGAHTETHQPLSVLSEDEQRKEITLSKHKLENILKKDVLEFSYPFGLQSDFSDLSIKIVKEAGLEIACTGVKRGVLPFMVDRYAIPRFNVMNWNSQEFEHKIREFFNLVI
ncbi:MAG: polysaccharide deacetylase family protein [Candidatus Calescibacterium sp.]|nr:polysaccharide deacetylase family protein [Candidatus Calescibacterium sp.]MCX7733201.1 polysaccharide deacetylase family protein [bacterium]MDW8086908.1 polysaccharide deacetylase family protein [Candidatus Calescibacterium sp.]